MSFVNYHTHCKRCKHAVGEEEDYIVEAIKHGFSELGMSDHIPYPDVDYGARMEYMEKDSYLDTMSAIKEKHGGKLEIYTGFESEYLKKYDKYYQSLLDDTRCDYLILGQHFFEMPDGKIQNVYDINDSKLFPLYAKSCVEAMRTGYFKMLGHPDLFGVCELKIDSNYQRAFDILIEGAEKYNFTLEYNANGLRRGMSRFEDGMRYQYPMDILWDMVKDTNVEVMVGSDCHNPEQLCDEYFVNSVKKMKER